MGSRVTDWALYGHLWGTDELRAVFDEEPRIQDWLDIFERPSMILRTSARLRQKHGD